MAVPTLRRRPPRDPEGRMALSEHLRELRQRITRAGIALVLGSIAGWFLWGSSGSIGSFRGVYAYIQDPLVQAAAEKGIEASVNFGQIGSAFDFQLKGALWVGVLVSSPVWIYQIWAFITPGLTRKERRYAIGFISAAVPLFLAGVGVAWLVLPNAVEFLIDFTPTDGSNIINATDYLSFTMRILLAFGLAFLMPVVLVGLNFAHLLSGRAVLKQWRISVFLSFLFSAIITPTSDITTMLVLALPLLVLFAIATGICLLNDRRRARTSDEPDYSALDDDTASTL
ncbi:twin-arginine translocase subunit TatC [Kineococcus glutinatus]|uniref:Sec-independent protein translocase protein TatC n=1 Tax=Kineococcus glutinatus TaxID=1070872 RepID=A0ABP9H4K5_9ACTN